MSEDKSYLNDLMDWVSENHKKRNEEMDSLSDVGNPNKPFTKKIIKENPNIPQDDAMDYVKNVNDDSSDYFMGAGMASPGLNSGIKTGALKAGDALKTGIKELPSLPVNTGVKLEGLAARLPETSRFRELLDTPALNKIREPLKQKRNIELMNRANQEMSDIAKANRVEEMALPSVDEVAQQRNYKNWLKDSAAEKQELAYNNNQTAIQDAIKQHNEQFKIDPNLEQTQPAISQELIDELLKKKKAD